MRLQHDRNAARLEPCTLHSFLVFERYGPVATTAGKLSAAGPHTPLAQG